MTRQASPTPAPQWFRQAVADGLQRLVALSLPGQPPAETIALTKESWIDILWPLRAWQRADAERLQSAVRYMASRIDRWPPPRAVLDHLPPRTTPRALPKPRSDRATGLAACAEIKRLLERRDGPDR